MAYSRKAIKYKKQAVACFLYLMEKGTSILMAGKLLLKTLY